jgi:flavorubredoxin
VNGCCGGRPVDYLIINHVGRPLRSHPWLIERLTPQRIFCSKRAKETLALYYGVETVEAWDLQVVTTGDEVSLGRNTLQFIEAPMLHWPDSMFTYVREAKTLLPNDAFGQHLATSKRFADEVDPAVLMEEASVLRQHPHALWQPHREDAGQDGEMGLEIETIGLAGVIWRRPGRGADRGSVRAGAVLKRPQRVALIYDTMWHSTEKMTMAIADGVAGRVECSVMKLSVNPRSGSRVRSSSRGPFSSARPPQQHYVPHRGETHVTSRSAAQPPRETYGLRLGRRAVKQVDAELRALGLEVVDPVEVRYSPSAVDGGVSRAGTQGGAKSQRRAMAVTVLGLAGSSRQGNNRHAARLVSRRGPE